MSEEPYAEAVVILPNRKRLHIGRRKDWKKQGREVDAQLTTEEDYRKEKAEMATGAIGQTPPTMIYFVIFYVPVLVVQ